jgi:hypothetical protein
MLRKLVVVAVVALVPGFALAAGTDVVAPAPVDSATHAVSGDLKTDKSVKTDTSAKPAKVVRHRVTNKVAPDKAKAGTPSDSKTETPKL